MTINKLSAARKIPPPLEIGDRVRITYQDLFGVVAEIGDGVVGVNVSGKLLEFRPFDLVYYPTPRQIGHMTRLIRRSRKDKKLRAALDLPRYG